MVSAYCDAQKVRKIGEINMISSRNISNLADYELIALDQTVREVPGGVFLMNASFYIVKGKYFAVEGDVWGLKQNANYKGFKVGDRVMWKTVTGYKKGTIEAIKDSENCVVIEDGTMNRTTIKYVKLLRADNPIPEE